MYAQDMITFMRWSFVQHGTSTSLPTLARVTIWLQETALFEQAWSRVCSDSSSWWFSEQLCLYTIAWTVFLLRQGSGHGIKHLWAYMMLGQLVAISVASNLFYVALLGSYPPGLILPGRTVSLSVVVPIGFSVATVFLSPYTSSGTFLYNLLAMHALLIIPLLSPPFGRQFRLADIYWCLSAFAFLLRIKSYLTLGSLGAVFQLPSTLHSHPAIASIGYDVLWTSLSLAAWWFPTTPGPAFLTFLWNSLLSPGVRAPETWGMMEFQVLLDDKRVAKEAGLQVDSDSDSDHSHSHSGGESD